MKDVYQQIVALLYAIWQRRWQAIIAAWAVSFIGWVIVYAVPDKYESFARIYVTSSGRAWTSAWSSSSVSTPPSDLAEMTTALDPKALSVICWVDRSTT